MHAQNFNPRDVYVRHRVEEASKEKWMDECGKQLDYLRKVQEASGKGNYTVQPSGGTPSSQNEDGGIVRSLLLNRFSSTLLQDMNSEQRTVRC